MDTVLDRAARLAARALNAPVAWIALLEGDELRLQGSSDLPASEASARPTPLPASFCRQVLAHGAPLLARHSHPLPVEAVDPAVQGHGVQAHLGVPLVDSEKQVLGVLCAGDRRPREWAVDEVETLQDLGAMVVAEIQRRRERLEWVRAERELAQATTARQALETQLERAERVRSQFAAALRHEFGQPLTVIQGFSELLCDGTLSAEEIQEYAAEINKEASHLSEIVANIRDMDQKVEEFAAARRPK